MDYIEGNKLIAEFIGYQTDEARLACEKEWRMSYRIHEHKYKTDRGYWETDFFPEEMKYHSYYDWIMPVVERIEELGFTVGIVRNSVHIMENGVVVASDCSTKKIDAIYSAVLEFIKWYNQNKTQEV
jgi:hypothetical protein